jgi:hypothetical protein
MKGVFISTIEPYRIFYDRTIIVKETPKPGYYYFGSKHSERKEKKEFMIYESPDRNINSSKSLNITDIEWEKCKVGNKNTVGNKNYIDENIRNGYFSKDKIHLYIENDNIKGLLDVVFNNNTFTSINYNIAFLNGEYQPWKMLRYDQEGFFQRHTDGIRNEIHFATAIIIPPINLNKYTGGELVLYGKDEELIIEADENDWKLVVFGLEIEHELKTIKSGQRIVFVCPFDFNREMKYISDTSVYSNLIEVKMDEKVVKKQKKSILKKIEKLEKEIDDYRKLLNNYEISNSQNNILHELIDEILEQLKTKNRNGFIVALNGYYHKPIPSDFNMKDGIVYNNIINYFKEQNIQIRVMNFACTLNKGDGSSPDWKYLSLSINCESYQSKNKEDGEYKFEDFEIICPTKFYDSEIIGDWVNQVSEYNDETYDNLLILNGTFLLCSLNNIFYEEPKKEDSNEESDEDLDEESDEESDNENN